MNELLEKALHAAEQNMTDLLHLYGAGCSMQALDIAVRDMKNDGLKLVKAARKALMNEALPAALAAAIGLEGQPCASGNALEEHNMAVLCRPAYNAVLNELEREGRLNSAGFVRDYVKHLVWWAQEEHAAAQGAPAAPAATLSAEAIRMLRADAAGLLAEKEWKELQVDGDVHDGAIQGRAYLATQLLAALASTPAALVAGLPAPYSGICALAVLDTLSKEQVCDWCSNGMNGQFDDTFDAGVSHGRAVLAAELLAAAPADAA